MNASNVNATTEKVASEQMSLPDFSQKVIDFGFEHFSNTTNDYGNFYQLTKSESDQIIDLLIIGVLWKKLHSYLSIDAIFYAPFFNYLNKRESKNRLVELNQRFKTFVLYSEHNKEIPLNQRFEYLYAWLKASNSFNETFKLIESWQYWADHLPLVKQQEIWQKLEDYAKWFTDALRYYFNTNWLSATNEISITESTSQYLLIINKIKSEIDFQDSMNEEGANAKLVSA